jgi:hypothetical protein
VEIRLNPFRFDGGQIPPGARIECCSQFFLLDGMRTCIGTLVTEAQHIQGPIVFGYRRQTRHVSWTLIGVERVEQSAVQHRFKPAPQTLQMNRVSRNEINLDPTTVGFLSRDCQRRFGHVKTQNRQSERSEVQSVLAGPAAGIKHGSGKPALGCQTHYCWLRPAYIPGCRAVVVRGVPGQSRHPFMAGREPTTERIIS